MNMSFKELIQNIQNHKLVATYWNSCNAMRIKDEDGDTLHTVKGAFKLSIDSDNETITVTVKSNLMTMSCNGITVDAPDSKDIEKAQKIKLMAKNSEISIKEREQAIFTMAEQFNEGRSVIAMSIKSPESENAKIAQVHSAPQKYTDAILEDGTPVRNYATINFTK